MWSELVFNWLLTFMVGLIVLHSVRHFLLVRSLPPGPTPLPFVGNLLGFIGKENNVKSVMNRLSDRYKDIYTLWLGPKPTVIVCNWELCREALITKKNIFSGRIIRKSVSLFLDGKKDITFTDFSPHWETLRKVFQSAVRKYSMNEKLTFLAADIVDESVDLMLKEHNPLDPNTFIHSIISNLLTSSAFGQRFTIDDPEFLSIRASNEELNETFGNGLPSDVHPFLSIFCKSRENAILKIANKTRGMIVQKFNEHKESYRKGVVRDFIDALLLAQEEAEEEEKDTLEYLTDENLVMVVMNYFGAGIDTTMAAMIWTLLLVGNHPEIQKKMRVEINNTIGNRIPSQNDRLSCPFTFSVISETLRWMPPVDFSLEHKSLCDTEIGGYKIASGTSCLFRITNSHFASAYWEEPEKFNPERFLDSSGRFNTVRPTGYMPFGIGRRACPGEKLALANVFLVITRLIQRCSFELLEGPGSVPLEAVTDSLFNFPKKFSMVVRKAEDY